MRKANLSSYEIEQYGILRENYNLFFFGRDDPFTDAVLDMLNTVANDYEAVRILAKFLPEVLLEKKWGLEEPELVKAVPVGVMNTLKRHDSLQRALTEEYYNNSDEEIDDDSIADWIDKNFDHYCRLWLDEVIQEVAE